MLGGAALGGAIALLGLGLQALVPESTLVVATACVVLVYGASGVVAASRLPYPSCSRQVPEGFIRTPYLRTTSFLWGADLGAGWTTHQASPALWTLCIAMLAIPAPAAIATGVCFAVVRGLTVLIGVRASSVEAAERRFDKIARSRRVLTSMGGVQTLALVAALVILQ
jgi:hypothetical protein